MNSLREGSSEPYFLCSSSEYYIAEVTKKKGTARNEEILSSRNRLSSLVRRLDPSIIRIVEVKSEVIIPQAQAPINYIYS